MSKVVSVRFSDDEYLKMIGAAAVANMSISAYVHWLISGRQQPGGDGMGQVLNRLDEIATIVSSLKNPALSPALPPSGKRKIDKNTLVAKLRERGVPSGTIRQVETVLEEMEKSNDA